jgi:hypothetical protein
MCRLHLVFNIVKLTTAPPDPIPGRHLQPPPPPEMIDGEDKYLVEKILDSKMFRGRLKFKIKWEGYGPEHDSWEYATEVYAPERVADFYQRNPAAPRQIRAATFSKIPFRPISPVYFEAKSRKRGGRCKGTLRFTLHRFHASNITSDRLPTRRPLPQSS